MRQRRLPWIPIAALAMALCIGVACCASDGFDPWPVAELDTDLSWDEDGFGSVAFSPDGQRLAVASGRWVELWKFETWNGLNTWLSERSLFHRETTVLSVALSPNGETLASGCDDGTIRLWDTVRGREIQALAGHTERVTSIGFSPDGETIASGSSDGTVRLWNAVTGEEIRVLTGGKGAWWGSCVAFSPCGQLLASSLSDNSIVVWDVRTGEETCSLEGHRDWISSLAFNPADRRMLASASDDYTIRFWDVTSGRDLTPSSGPGGVPLAFSPDGKTLATGTCLWDVRAVKCVADIHAGEGRMLSVAFNAGGATFAWESAEKTIEVWDMETIECTHVLDDGDSYNADSLVFSPNGETLAITTWEGDTTLWNVATGDSMWSLDDAAPVSFSLDGRVLAVEALPFNGAIELRDVSACDEIAILEIESSIFAVALDRHGDLLAGLGIDETLPCYEDGLGLWDVEAGRRLWFLADETLYWGGALAFSSDGKLLAASTDEAIRLVDVASGETIRTLLGEVGGARQLAFSPDGGTLAACRENLIELWDAATGETIRTFAGQDDEIDQIVFSADGDTLATLSESDLKIWDVSFLHPQKPQVALADEPNDVVKGMTVRFDFTFSDANGDVTIVEFRPTEGPDIALERAPHMGELLDVVNGGFSLEVSPTEVGSYRAEVILIDRMGLESKPADIAFEVRLPTPPRIESVTFPQAVPTGTVQNGSIRFAHAEGGIAEGRFEVLEGDPAAITFEPGLSFDPEIADMPEGVIPFSVSVAQAQSVKVAVILVDEANQDSNCGELIFEAYAPTPPRIVEATLPQLIRTDRKNEASVAFEDADGDVVQARFEILEGDPETIEISPGLHFNPSVAGVTAGTIGFGIRVDVPQSVALALILVDETELTSSVRVLRFEAKTPTPPEIRGGMLPESIRIGEPCEGYLQCRDAEGNIAEVRFEVVEGSRAGIQIDPASRFDPGLKGQTDGEIPFTVTASQPETVTIVAILVDETDLESGRHEFRFEAYTPTRPELSLRTFPDLVPTDKLHRASFEFSDAEGDAAEVRFEIVQGDPSTIEIGPGRFDPEVRGRDEGAIRFTVRATEPQTVKLRAFLVDDEGLQSDAVDIGFDAYASTPPRIVRVTFPRAVDANTYQNGILEFEDAEGDIVEACIDGGGLLEVRPDFCFDPGIIGQTHGFIRFSVLTEEYDGCGLLQCWLVDAARKESNLVELDFTIE